MAAFLAYLLGKLNGLKPVETNSRSRFNHHLGLHPPSISHMVLDSELLKQFNEIFVIGDVHGCYDELCDLLELAKVKDDKVLKIFVGDLVNKGPKNAEVLNYVQKQISCLSVRGNHDEIVLKVLLDHSNTPNQPFPPKFSWLANLSKENTSYLAELPYTISIPSLDSIIVHAGLVPGIPLQQMSLYNLVNMRNIIIEDYFSGDGVRATKYDSIGEPWSSLWPGPQHVYFGHDAKRMLQQYAYTTGLDTGCVYGNKLTGTFIYGPRTGTFYEVNARLLYKEVS